MKTESKIISNLQAKVGKARKSVGGEGAVLRGTLSSKVEGSMWCELKFYVKP